MLADTFTFDDFSSENRMTGYTILYVPNELSLVMEECVGIVHLKYLNNGVPFRSDVNFPCLVNTAVADIHIMYNERVQYLHTHLLQSSHLYCAALFLHY